MARILIVEDEPRISSFIEKGLSANGFTATTVTDGPTGYDYAMTGGFDLMVLDIGLPSMDGFTVLRKLREDGNQIPVIVLTDQEAAAEAHHAMPAILRRVDLRVAHEHVPVRRRREVPGHPLPRELVVGLAHQRLGLGEIAHRVVALERYPGQRVGDDRLYQRFGLGRQRGKQQKSGQNRPERGSYG